MLNQLSLRSRLLAVIAVAVLGMFTLALLAAFSTKQLLLEERKAQIRAVTQGVYNIVVHYHQLASAGKMTVEEAQEQAKIAIRQTRFNGPEGKSDYFYVWKPDGTNVVHALKPEWEGKPVGDSIKDGSGRLVIRELASQLANQNSTYLETVFIKSKDDPALYPKILYAQRFAPWEWLIGTGVYIDEINASFYSVLRELLLAAAIPLFLIVVACMLVIRSVQRQIGGEPELANRIMQQIAAGDLRTDLPPVPEGSMLHTLGRMAGALRQMLTDISRNASELASNAEAINNSAAQIANNASVQAESTSAMAAAIGELTASSTHISESAEKSSLDSADASRLSQEGKTRAENAAQAMSRIANTVADGSGRIRKLDERANQVSSIAGVIKEIAGQTNLLALNAAIEAARAGEQGRGFAVVADEVRKLAERTAAATVEIEQMIAAIQEETDSAVDAMDSALPEVQEGVRLAQEAAESLAVIEAGALRTLQHIRDVAEATREQSAASTSIAQKVENIAGMVEQTSSAMQGTASTAHNLEAVAGQLQAMVQRFRL